MFSVLDSAGNESAGQPPDSKRQTEQPQGWSTEPTESPGRAGFDSATLTD